MTYACMPTLKIFPVTLDGCIKYPSQLNTTIYEPKPKNNLDSMIELYKDINKLPTSPLLRFQVFQSLFQIMFPDKAFILDESEYMNSWKFVSVCYKFKHNVIAGVNRFSHFLSQKNISDLLCTI